MTDAEGMPMGDSLQRVRDWRIGLERSDLSLREAFDALRSIGLAQAEVPLMVKLVENPAYDLPGFDFFHGATDLRTHDMIHVLLGRGLLAKDEAFVIGFTMGSTDRVTHNEERLYGLISKYLYPKAYRFTDDDLRVFRDAVRLGYVSDCTPLHAADYAPLLDLSLEHARRALGIETELLRAYYAIEKRRYPDSPESQRLDQP
jgi:hypothetical protein